MPSETAEIIGIKKDLEYIKKQVDNLSRDIKAGYVTKVELNSKIKPLEESRKVFNGFITLLATSVIVALIGLVVLK